MLELAAAVRDARARSCYDCGKCTASCPIPRAGGSYSPRRNVLAAVAGQRDQIIRNGALFSCLTCSLCDRRCPAGVNYTELVLAMREIAHDAGVQPDCPHGGALQSVMRMMARGCTQQDRLAWIDEGLQTRPETGEVFYWTGCTMYFDALFPEFDLSSLDGNRASVKILNRLGVEPVVSSEERCCGHDLLWNGDREGFEALARQNVDLVASSGAETLVVSCAECLRTWKKDYSPFFKGKMPRVVHFTDYLAEHLDELEFKSNGRQVVTYHDPCRMGRHLEVYDPPRAVLEAIPGLELVEMRHSGPSATCCAGGTWSSCDRFAKKIQVGRLTEARETGADVMATACPKCRIHFRCAMKDPNLGDDIQIEMRDVAEIVADALT